MLTNAKSNVKNTPLVPTSLMSSLNKNVISSLEQVQDVPEIWTWFLDPSTALVDVMVDTLRVTTFWSQRRLPMLKLASRYANLALIAKDGLLALMIILACFMTIENIISGRGWLTYLWIEDSVHLKLNMCCKIRGVSLGGLGRLTLQNILTISVDGETAPRRNDSKSNPLIRSNLARSFQSSNMFILFVSLLHYDWWLRWA